MIEVPGELLVSLVRYNRAAGREFAAVLLGLDRERARAWTSGRVLQNCLWDVGDGESRLGEDQVEIGRQLLGQG